MPQAQPQPYVPYEPPEALDLSEANFAPSPPKSMYSNVSDETKKGVQSGDNVGGYFIPESDSPDKNSVEEYIESPRNDYPEVLNHYQSPDIGNAKGVIHGVCSTNSDNYHEGKVDSLNSLNSQSLDPRPELVQNAIMTMTLGDKDSEDGLMLSISGGTKPLSQPDVVPVGIMASVHASSSSCHSVSRDFQSENSPNVHSGIECDSESKHHVQSDNDNHTTEVPAEHRLRDFLQGKHGPHIHAGPTLNLSENAEETNNPMDSEEVINIDGSKGLTPEALNCVMSGPMLTDSIEGTASLSSSGTSPADLVQESIESQATTASCHSSVDHNIQAEPVSLEQREHSNISNTDAVGVMVSPQPSAEQTDTWEVHDASIPHDDRALSVSSQPETISASHEENSNQNEDSVACVVQSSQEPADVPSIIEPSASPTEFSMGAGFDNKDLSDEGILEDMEANLDNLPLAESMDAVALADEIANQHNLEPVPTAQLQSPTSAHGLLREATASPQSVGSASEELLPPPVSSPERRGSGGSVERFLIPNITSPMITTPMDDTGMSKVPGFTPGLSTTSEVSEEAEDQECNEGQEVFTKVHETESCIPRQSDTSVRTTAGGEPDGVVRPKDLPVITPTRKNRPNSLLGLSTPDLGSMAYTDIGSAVGQGGVGGISHQSTDSPGTVIEEPSNPVTAPAARNTNDIINLQLAQQKSSGGMSPMRKNQLNMEIKQQNEHPAERPSEGRVSDTAEGHPHAAPAVITSRSQLALGIGMNLSPQPGHQQPSPRSPLTPGSTTRQVQPPNSLVGLSMPQNYALPPPTGLPEQGGPAVQAHQPRTDTGPTPTPPSSLDLSTPSQPGMPQPLTQRRPCSLNLPPRGDFQPQGSGRSPSITPDLGEPGGAAGEDASVASSESSIGAQTPVSPEEVARAAGQTGFPESCPFFSVKNFHMK